MTDDNKPEQVTVKSSAMDNRVVLYETHPDHVTEDNPTGEIYIVADGTTHTVAKTPEVAERMRTGLLVESNSRDMEQDKAQATMRADNARIARIEAEAKAKADALAAARVSKQPAN